MTLPSARHDRAAARPAAHPPRGLAELADLGYTDIWSAEADGADAFTPLALAAAWEPRLRLGTAIVPAYTRAPACFAQCVATLADAAPGRFAIGIGSSSNVIVERWNGVPFVEPYKKVRDVVRFLRDALERREGQPRSTTRSRSRASGSASARRSTRRSSSPRCARGCCASPAARPTARSSTGCRPTTCDRRRRGQRRRRRRRPGDRGPDLRVPEREHRGRARRRPSSPSPPTSTCRCTPSSTAGWAAASGCRGCGTPGRPATARRPWRRSPTRSSTSWSSTGRRRPAGERIQEYFDNGVTTSSLAVMPLDPDVEVLGRGPRAGSERRLTSRRGPAHAAGRRVDVGRSSAGRAFEAGPDLGDVAQATAAGGLVEAELQRHRRGVGQQGELLGGGGGGGRGHAAIMNRGCHVIQAPTVH